MTIDYPNTAFIAGETDGCKEDAPFDKERTNPHFII